MGQFLGFCDDNSSLVARIRNLATNFVSPQFHVVFDDKFTTIENDVQLEDTEVRQIFTELFSTCRDHYRDSVPVLHVPDSEVESEGADTNVPEGEATQVDPPIEIGGEWLL